MKITDAYLAANADNPLARVALEQRAHLARQLAQIAELERTLQNMQRAYERLRRENAEVRSAPAARKS